MEFWLGFALAYGLAGALVLRLLLASHHAIRPDRQHSLIASAYAFLVWPAILMHLGNMP